jgi:FHA domain
MACFLEIYQPDGQLYNPHGQEDSRYRLSEMISSLGKNEITIGRLEKSNPNESTDIRLPANDYKISRKHCSIEIKDNCYFWIKSNSTHPTYLREANLSNPDVDIYVINDKDAGYRLRNGDEILIASNFSGQDKSNWRCVFHDDSETESAQGLDSFQIKYNYNLELRTLEIESSIQEKQSIQFTGQENTLVECLARKFRKDSKCSYVTYKELMHSVVGSSERSSPSRLSPLVSRINKAIIDRIIPEHEKTDNKDVKKLKFILNVSGYGYRINESPIIL